MKYRQYAKRLLGTTGVAVVLAMGSTGMEAVSTDAFISAAFADSDSHSGGKHEPKGRGGSRGGGDGQGQGGGKRHGQSGTGGGESGSGHVPGGVTSSSDESDSEGRGPKYKGGGAGSAGSSGGKPVWAQEGIPEVELGRLNMGRAPDHVLKRQLDEAVATYDPAMTDFYTKSLPEVIAILQDPATFEATVRIDSPPQNLALYKDLILNSGTVLPIPPGSVNVGTMSAIFLGTASDKEIEISKDSIVAINAILGLPALSDSAAETLATNANNVRAAIKTGHDG